MLNLAARVAEQALLDLRTRAVLAGALLGWLAWAMSRVEGGDVWRGIAALVVVLAGASAFVLHALAGVGERSRATRDGLSARARSLVCLLGTGVVLAVHALQTVLG